MSHIGQHSDTRSSNRKAKQESELRHKLEEAEAKLIKEKKYKDAMMMAALRKLTPKQMKELGITIIYGEPDPNATPSSPNYMRPTTASARHRVAKGGRRTRKRRNGKKKTVRKGGRMRKGGGMRKSGMRRRRRHLRHQTQRQPVAEREAFATNEIPLTVFYNDAEIQTSQEPQLLYQLSDNFSIYAKKQEDGSVKLYLKMFKFPIKDDTEIKQMIFKVMIDVASSSISYALDVVLVMETKFPEGKNVTQPVELTEDKANDIFTKMGEPDKLQNLIGEAKVKRNNRERLMGSRYDVSSSQPYIIHGTNNK